MSHILRYGIVDCFCVVEMIFAPILIYLILFRSAQLRHYRFYLINTAGWNMFFDLVVCFMRPTFYFPTECVSIDPMISVGSQWTRPLLAMCMVGAVHMDLSVAWNLLYRFVQPFPGCLQRMMENFTASMLFVITAQVLVSAYGLVPLFYTTPEQQQLVERMSNVSANMFCYSGSELLHVGAYALSAFIAFFFVVGIILYVILLKTLKFDSKIMNKRTYRLQVMLLQAMSAQLLFAFIFLLTPSFLFTYSFAARWQNGAQVATACFALMTVHGCIDVITMLWCITPYRVIVLQWMGIYARPSARLSVQTLVKNKVSTTKSVTHSSTDNRRRTVF